jgi:nitrite reductase (NADH) small subunit
MTNAAPAGERVAYNLGPVDGIPMGEGRTFEVGSVAVAVFRTRAGEVFATQAACPHREGPLADGILGPKTIICPLHAYQFELASGRPLGHDCGALATYPAWIDDAGDVRMSLA